MKPKRQRQRTGSKVSEQQKQQRGHKRIMQQLPFWTAAPDSSDHQKQQAAQPKKCASRERPQRNPQNSQFQTNQNRRRPDGLRELAQRTNRKKHNRAACKREREKDVVRNLLVKTAAQHQRAGRDRDHNRCCRPAPTAS